MVYEIMKVSENNTSRFKIPILYYTNASLYNAYMIFRVLSGTPACPQGVVAPQPTWCRGQCWCTCPAVRASCVVEPQIQIKAVSSLVQLSSIKAVQLVQKEPLPRKMQIVIEALKLSSGMANFHSCTWNLWIWTTPEWVWKLIFVGCQYIASILASETPSYIHYYNIIIISKPNSHIAYVISALSPFGPGLVNSIGAPFSPGRLHTVGDTLDWLRSRSSCWTGWLMGHILLSSLLDWVSSTKRNRTPFEPSWGFYTCELHMCVYYIAMMPLAQGGVQWTYH